jgi:hypothetical protein
VANIKAAKRRPHLSVIERDSIANSLTITTKWTSCVVPPIRGGQRLQTWPGQLGRKDSAIRAGLRCLFRHRSKPPLANPFAHLKLSRCLRSPSNPTPLTNGSIATYRGKKQPPTGHGNSLLYNQQTCCVTYLPSGIAGQRKRPVKGSKYVMQVLSPISARSQTEVACPHSAYSPRLASQAQEPNRHCPHHDPGARRCADELDHIKTWRPEAASNAK